MIRRFVAAALLVLALGGPLAWADANEAVTSSNPDFVNAVKAVKAQDYRAAVALLNKVVAAEPKNADAFNYLGYSFRKMGDVQTALKHYDRALTLDPNHRGAHEYMGEAYLMVGDVAKAREHLAQLDKICWLGCEEFTDLKQAIAAYEAQHKQ